jgi:DNA-binding NarL/FixJ family response regulator
VQLHSIGGRQWFIGRRLPSASALEFSRDDGSKARHTTLSDREYKVFELLVAGKACTQIARELSLSVKTVSTHKARMFHKMNLSNHAELMQYAIANNLVVAQPSWPAASGMGVGAGSLPDDGQNVRAIP